ncbi:MAG TPA: hypothetical protein VE890_03090 [Thermoguttaceae bacterium]|nr:hypothetical protein [Thermoguttaceae bacterium]
MKTLRTAICSFAILAACGNLGIAAVKVSVVDNSPQAEFGATKVREAVALAEPSKDWQITLRLMPKDGANGIEREGFRIRKGIEDNDRHIDISAIDPAGLLYGGLEVAEVVRTLGIEQLKDDTQNPYMQMRGTKFNIPLDVRTPSYTDVCDAAQINIPEMWSFDFWREYIDTLASYRYNYVSLWNLHPFPSLVKVPEYPDVALEDVWRSKVDWDENYSLQGRGFVTDEILREVEVVKRLTIDEKIAFWRKVMAYGKSRNVDFYFVTWNIFTYGTAGKYGITDDYRNKTTVDYFRRSVHQMFRTYPDLAGIGLTTGENMPGMDFQAKEDWALATYGQGVLDAARDQPDRKITFIHRQHMAKATDISRTFQPLIDSPNVDFIFSFKYAKAHVYSATKQPYHHDFVEDLGERKTIWTLRNDDVYYFRWGAPDFVRRFVSNIPHDVSQGYYYGSDQYVWGREFLQRNAESRRLEIDKHWYQWLLWGRFAYNPTLDNERLKAIVADRFGLSPVQGSRLFSTWQSASMIYPLTTGFHWGSLDFQWYIEGCESQAGYAQNETGFHDVNRFINLPPHAESNCLSIPDYVKMAGEPNTSGKHTPMEVAAAIEKHAERALAGLKAMPSTENTELRQTLADIRIVANLGLYYADKIRGATQVAIFRETQDKRAQVRAVDHLVDAARHWHDYASLALEHHKNPLWTNRVGYVDWKKNYQYALEDIRIAGGDPTDHGLPTSVDAESEPVVRWPRSRDN